MDFEIQRDHKIVLNCL